MTIFARAASFAAVAFCATALVTATTPGRAVELDQAAQVVELPKAEPATAAEVSSSAPASAAPVFGPPVEIVQPLPSDHPATPAAAGDVRPEYASLDAAVADEELSCLAIGVYFESKGEPLAGQLAVAGVILNRAQSGRFPRSVCSVLTQRGQFSFVRGGRLPRVDTGSRDWRRALAVAQVARRDLWHSPFPDALYFHARYVSPKWRRARVGTVGNHIFYR